MNVIRVFPGKTKATPDDEFTRFGPPGLFDEADEVHVSVTFTWHRDRAEQLAREWERVAPVKIGGVAYGDRSLDFVPGKYVKPGYIFTSRGCPRRCWFCSVHTFWPKPHLLPIHDGWNILDDNLLACPRHHVEAVFAMLQRQGRRIHFTGGLEARALKDYQVDLLAKLKPRPAMYWAYDPGDPFETLRDAARKLIQAGFTAESHRLGCYVLIGWRGVPGQPDDTFDAAEKRLRDMLSIGFTPFAMLYRPEGTGQEPDAQWKAFRRQWVRPTIIHARTTESHP